MSSFLSNGDPAAIEGLYEQYCKNPESIDSEWRNFFQGFEFSRTEFEDNDGNLVITDVEQGSEAEEKGLKEGDIIKRVGTQQVKSLKEFKKKEKVARSRGSLLLLIKKDDGSSLFVTLNY